MARTHEIKQQVRRTYPAGPHVETDRGVHFRVWAPKRKLVELLLHDGGGPGIPLEPEEDGYFSGWVEQAGPGTRYWLRLDENTKRKDPASWYQPHGAEGPSQVFQSQFPWTDQSWAGVFPDGHILYEMHIGTFTREGTWKAAMEHLHRLADDGITAVEVMPVHQFPGRFGWGYDGVDLYAPTCQYGTPDGFREFVNMAHRLGLGVILDVVYNHFGPSGCVLRDFSPDYFARNYKGEWGDAINYDGSNAGPVRDFIAANAQYWIREFHLDGLRLDATQQIFDASPEHIVARIGREARQAAPTRTILMIAESDLRDTRLVRKAEENGFGLDALWNDDFHHAAKVALTGNNAGYLRSFRASAQEFVSAAKLGFLYQGQPSGLDHEQHGRSGRGLSPAHWINYLDNHDQIANSGTGLRSRILSQPGLYRAMTALLLLMPQTPLLFQGQEFGAESPFLFFADHKPELAQAVHKGRAQFLSQFANLASDEMRQCLPDPADPAVFGRCKLDHNERHQHKQVHALHRDLIQLRRHDPVFASQAKEGIDGAVFNERAFVLRFFSRQDGDRLLVLNMGVGFDLRPAPEPLLASPENRGWRLLWSSETPRYGGSGTPPLESSEGWHVPGCAAFVLAARPCP